ncbi:uncharacterized protein MEPE_01800 [Melanopsichium pennsylvanicum]|uniref:Alpha-1,2-mannosidase n=2 Tax=Melanopsichium pennsylvanicum TaxID=63383 RepID=A0AAJ4XI91_9BASI|nr:glycoside hydrolase family 92 protein [Melanopsichium pennsylvanicum 4]SNX83094.1 uncharacterized protein MEPE_01800 [Melanopsichium pennsylvanicum]
MQPVKSCRPLNLLAGILVASQCSLISDRQAPFSADITAIAPAEDAFTLPQCYPFCSDANHAVSQVEATRYSSRVGTLQWVDPRIGTNGPDPSEYGGMVPSVALPFAGVRTVPMTRENLVSGCAYHDNDTVNIGFLASRQPAIWMGDYGFATIFGGRGEVKLRQHERGHKYERSQEFVSPFKYAAKMGNDSQDIFAELVGKSRAAIVQYTYASSKNDGDERGPYIGIQASREQWRGSVHINVERGEVSGYNTERMDYRLGPHEAPGFKGYFVYRFEYQRSASSDEWEAGFPNDGVGTAHTNATGVALHPDERARWNELGAYAFVQFPAETTKVRVRIGLSLISEEQARYNLDVEMPDGTSVEGVVDELIEAWRSKTERIKVTGGTEEQKRILYTGIFHASQYPAEHAEPIPLNHTASILRHGSEDKHSYHYYSGYTDSVHKVGSGAQRYQSWSIWDIYRAQWNLLILLEPQRVVDMVRSLLDIYDESGFLPMWSTFTETNIMISTHADSLIAEAVVKGVKGFDIEKAWEAVKKDGTVPPERDDELRYEDREEYTPLEVRAGLTWYNSSGYVPLDGWAESTSRTLDYAYDDHAIAVLAKLLGKEGDAEFFSNRSKNYRHVFDHEKGLMAARLKNGTFLTQPLPNPRGRQEGFTEGNSFDYSFDVVQDVPGLAQLVGGREKLVALLDRHFEEGHNDQSNEPSHHIPYLYSLLGEASKTQRLIRDISYEGFSDQPDGYAGNEDCGQQSSWYIFSSMGIYPVNPVSGGYVVSSPFFETIEIDIPPRSEREKGSKLRIEAPGADDKHVYVANLTVNGREVQRPKLTWKDLIAGGTWNFGLSDTPQPWGNDRHVEPLYA